MVRHSALQPTQPERCSVPSDARWQMGPLTDSEVRALPALVEFVEAGRALNLGRDRAYEMRRQGRFPVPVLQVGRSFRVRKADLLAYLGLDRAVAG